MHDLDFPHPDERVLHRPQTCVSCDRFPQLQGVRHLWRLNFTGEFDPTKYPDPALAVLRPRAYDEQGNAPWPPRG
jgi:hypothetical protein